ncbi:TPA: DUF2129 domain-containing protein [Streptococcus suis]
MFEKQPRTCLTIYLHYNRDARKLSQYGDLIYHSKRLRYVSVYINQDQQEEIMAKLKKEKFVKKVVTSYFKDINQDFVGSLWREEEAVM